MPNNERHKLRKEKKEKKENLSKQIVTRYRMGMSDKPNSTSNLLRTSRVSSYDSSIGLQLRKDKDKDTEGGEKSKDSKKASKDKKKDPKEDEDLKS